MKRLTIGILVALSSTTTLASAQPTATQMADRLQAVHAIAQGDWCGLAIPSEFVTALLAAAIQSSSSPNWVAQHVDLFEEEVQIASLDQADICERDAVLRASAHAASQLTSQIMERLERAIADLRGDNLEPGQYDAFMDWLPSLAVAGLSLEELISNTIGEPRPSRPNDGLHFFVRLYGHEFAQDLDRAFKSHLEDRCRAKLKDSGAIWDSLGRHGIPRRANTEHERSMMKAGTMLVLLIGGRAHTQGETLCSRDSADALLELIAPAIAHANPMKEVTITERTLERDRQAQFVEISLNFHDLTTSLLRGPPGGPIPAIVETAHAIEAGRLPMSAVDVDLITSSAPYLVLGQQGGPRNLDLDATVTVNFMPIGSCDAPSSPRTMALQLKDPVDGDPEEIARGQEAVRGNHGHCAPARPISPLVSRFGGTYTGPLRALPAELISALEAGFGPVLYLCGYDFTGRYLTGGWEDALAFAIWADTSGHTAATARRAHGLCGGRERPGSDRVSIDNACATPADGTAWRSPASPSPSHWEAFHWCELRIPQCNRPDVDAEASRVNLWNRDGRLLGDLVLYGGVYQALFPCHKGG